METTTTASRRATIPIHLDGMPDYASLIKPDRIHSSLYLSEQIFADEMKKLFYGGWVFVGHESEIPNPNDFITRMLGLEPVIMVRTREGEISVMSNRCSHRGNLVCPKETGSARAFTCDYHGWTFNQKGDLIGVPLNDDETRDRSCLGLQKPMQIGECGGFIFATYNPDSGPLSDYLGAAHDLIMRSVSLSPTGKIKLTAGWIKQQFRSNWKMLPENSTDGYHAPYVHSSFVRTFAPNTQYEPLGAVDTWRSNTGRPSRPTRCNGSVAPRRRSPSTSRR
jgi:phenylpropionate dioxygenase-like ring-hydroxylating dioxygenase large terminal subunit